MSMRTEDSSTVKKLYKGIPDGCDLEEGLTIGGDREY